MKNDQIIVVRGNDAVDSGYVEICYSSSAPTSPLHLDFTREDGFKCSISLHHDSVAKLVKLIINNKF